MKISIDIKVVGICWSWMDFNSKFSHIQWYWIQQFFTHHHVQNAINVATHYQKGKGMSFSPFGENDNENMGGNENDYESD